jgi:hypothetical protein
MPLWSFVVNGVKKLREKALGLLQRLPVRELRERLRDLSPAGRRLFFLGSGLFLALFIGLIAIASLMNRNRGGASGGELGALFQPLAIPPEELFLPGEPDFLPELLLERPPRDSWTLEDVRPFWTDPLEGGDGPWRDRVESVIDELLESVP